MARRASLLNRVEKPLSATAPIEQIVARLQSLESRFAPVESTQAQSAATAAAARDIAEEALLASQNPRTITSTQIVNGRLIITYSDGTTQDAGAIGGGVITPPTPITISGTPPLTGTVGQAYTFTPTTANGSGAKTFALASGVLLGGLSFNTATGAITGSPTVAGTISNLSIRVTDSTGTAATAPVNVVIAAAPVTYTLDNTNDDSTLAGTAVQGWAAAHAAIRARLAGAGQSVGSDTSRPINVQTAELLAAVEALEAQTAPVQHYAAGGGGSVVEGNPTTVQHYAAAGGGSVVEGN